MEIGFVEEYIITLEETLYFPAPGVFSPGEPRALFELQWSNITWGRVELDVSSARVTIPFSWSRCPYALTAWDQCLTIYRNGERVWKGPLVGWRTTENGMELAGLDILAMARKRFLYQDRTFTAQDVWAVVSQLVQDVETGEGLTRVWANMDPAQTNPAETFGSTTTRVYLAAQLTTLFEAMQALAKEEGLFFTAISDIVHYGPLVDYASAEIQPALDEHTVLTRPHITLDATGMATAVYGTDGEQGYGGAGIISLVTATGGTGPYTTMLLEARASADGRVGDDPTTLAALTAIEASTPQVTIEAIPLSPTFGHDSVDFTGINTLRPGLVARWAFDERCATQVPVTSGRPTAITPVGDAYEASGYSGTSEIERVRLVRLDVTVDKTETGLDERISASFIPWAGNY